MYHMLGSLLGQTFSADDLLIVGLLVALEGILSIDNALVLGLLARQLPRHQQAKALTYGLVGAFVFRVIAIGTAAYLMEWRIAKLLGGIYLVYVAARHFYSEWRGADDGTVSQERSGNAVPTGQLAADNAGTDAEDCPGEEPGAVEPRGRRRPRIARFWPTVAVIELTDIAFAVDSILAAIAMVWSAPKPVGQRFHPKLWVVVTGGMLGVILMRFAAIGFIKLLDRFSRFESAAYLLVLVIGGKLVADWGFNTDPHHPALNFHDATGAAFWVFWGLMMFCFGVGFVPRRRDVRSVGERA
jgi:YkoY family integral membrane protein